jgi:hypothetical protein
MSTRLPPRLQAHEDYIRAKQQMLRAIPLSVNRRLTLFGWVPQLYRPSDDVIETATAATRIIGQTRVRKLS